MRAAQITIAVSQGQDGNPTLGMQFVGDELMLIPLLGAITHAQQWVSNRISNRIGEGAWGTPDGVREPAPSENASGLPRKERNEYPSEQKVSRDKAMEATAYAIGSLQQRLKIMESSPETATFIIDPELLSKL